MSNKIFICVVTLFTLICVSTAAVSQSVQTVRHIALKGKDTQTGYYFYDVLELALAKTVKTHGQYNLQNSKVVMRQGRAIKQLVDSNLIDVIWTMTSIEREQQLIPVRIPLLKGLLGYRVFIICKGNQQAFSDINSLSQLSKLTAGLGHDWPDTQILRANGLPVVTNSNFEGLFGMLQKGRFDYFPRGVNEAWAEVALHKENNVAVEQSLLLQYPAPLYFFVSPNNAKLAQRLEQGLRIALADGSFDRLFYQHLHPETLINLQSMNKRKTFTLKNPLLPQLTPLQDETLWLTVSE